MAAAVAAVAAAAVAAAVAAAAVAKVVAAAVVMSFSCFGEILRREKKALLRRENLGSEAIYEER